MTDPIEQYKADQYDAVSGIAKDAIDLSKELDQQLDEINFNWVAMMTTVVARHALAMGYNREAIGEILISLGNAIRNPPDVAENMSPLDLEMLDNTGHFMIYTTKEKPDA